MALEQAEISMAVFNYEIVSIRMRKVLKRNQEKGGLHNTQLFLKRQLVLWNNRKKKVMKISSVQGILRRK
jgi:hypothetical protein